MTERSLLQHAGNGETLAQHWIEASRGRPRAGALDPEAAADFLRALAAALTDAANRRDKGQAVDDTSLVAAGRAFAWAVGSPAVAIEHLIALRSAFQLLLCDPGQQPAMSTIHLLIDEVVSGIVRETVVDLERDALLDPLTGLFNRRALARNLDLEIGRANRQDRPFSIVFLDVDHLKYTNDTQGHAAGDAVLTSVAAGLRTVLRQADSAYRVGGDEFVVLLPETESHAIDTVIERVVSEDMPRCTWGAASYPQDATTAEGLLQAADQQLLARRHSGRPGASGADIGCQP